ncbi:MAG: hypothetical protein ACFB9N_02175 [Geitlerinemataceae cyanobacterium]
MELTTAPRLFEFPNAIGERAGSAESAFDQHRSRAPKKVRAGVKMSQHRSIERIRHT